MNLLTSRTKFFFHDKVSYHDVEQLHKIIQTIDLGSLEFTSKLEFQILITSENVLRRHQLPPPAPIMKAGFELIAFATFLKSYILSLRVFGST